ncbi:S-phase kinase-associated protein 1 [Nematocida sp. AWRm77]|nr:S-phase kinase-associated protein 1 [Nematocida sp. AWRm77]
MKIITRDGAKYYLAESVYRQSVLLRHISEEVTIPEEGIEILVYSDVFEKILEFMNSHASDGEVSEDYDTFDVMMTDFDKQFVEMDPTLLFRVTSAANYLNMPVLLELCCKVIADSLKEKTAEEIKKYLSITESGTVKDEESVRKEYQWIEE